jgi:hypothetical protein
MVAGHKQRTLSVSGGRLAGASHTPALGATHTREAGDGALPETQFSLQPSNIKPPSSQDGLAQAVTDASSSRILKLW